MPQTTPLPPSVIAATDLSPRSAAVAGRAARIAETLGARLILAHARGESGEETPGDAAPEAETRLLAGEPGKAIAALARAENACLIVLGLHRERRVLDLLRLTTMERIVLAAPCPVLIAHQPPQDAYRHILAPTDFAEASAEALKMAARLAPGADLHAIHALQLPLGGLVKLAPRENDTAMEKAQARRAQFLATPGLPALAEPPEIVPGGVHEVLDYRRRELGADLVAIGLHSGREHPLGYYARDLMRAPPTDLLIARPPAD